MNKLLLTAVLGLFLLSIVNVSALSGGVSPGSIRFDQKVGENVCKTLRFWSDGNSAQISDRWAEKNTTGYNTWNWVRFNATAKSNAVHFSYNNTAKGTDTVEICVNSTTIGESRGILLVQPKHNGNQGIRFGIWLRTVIR